MTPPRVCLASIAVALSGCAALPDAAVRYYLPKTTVNVKVVRTVACDSDDHLVISNVATPTVVHSADLGKKHTVTLSQLKGPFSDSDVKVQFYDDGRLKGFNSSSTGEGEAALKTVVSIVTPFLGVVRGTPKEPSACAQIKKEGGGKPLTITYSGVIALSEHTTTPIGLEATSQIYSDLAPAVGTVCANVGTVTNPEPPVSYNPKATEPALEVSEPAIVQITISAGGPNRCDAGKVWEGEVQVAQLGTNYKLPMPKAVIFGKEAVGVAFAESGALSSVQFTNSTGAGQGLNVINAANAALKPESTAQKAADVKAEADLIAEQQRLVGCLADPKDCK